VFPNTLLFNARSLGEWRRDSPREVDIISGSFLMIERSLWIELGGFDTRFFMYAEDVDLCMRARKAGRLCLFTPDAEIVHHGGGSEPYVASKMTKLLRAKAQLYGKHWSPTEAWLGRRFLDLRVTTRLLGYKLLRDSERANEWRNVWQSRDAWHRVG
jgi:GT2 family glycosyltransferase